MYIPSYKTVKNLTDSPYRFAILVAQRAKELNEGAKPYINPKNKSFVSVAMEEIVEGFIVEDKYNE